MVQSAPKPRGRERAGEQPPKVVILCGGLGTRMREETEFRPKPMVEIGGRPILWHIMKLFAHHGLDDFVICTGYRGQMIKNFFLDYEAWTSDVSMTLGEPDSVRFHGSHTEVGWHVSVIDTGAETMTGGRVKRVSNEIGNRTFMVTYGDGVADVDLTELLAFHRAHGKLATVTATRPLSRFGHVDLDDRFVVQRFREKPQSEDWVSSGYFVFEPEFLDLLDDNSILEREPLERLAKEGEIVAYRHEGFWRPMDTYRELLMLNELWDSGDAPWAVWNR